MSDRLRDLIRSEFNRQAQEDVHGGQKCLHVWRDDSGALIGLDGIFDLDQLVVAIRDFINDERGD